MDPLSDVLTILQPSSYMFRGLEAGGSWALQFPPNQGMRCYAVLSGSCWLSVEEDEPIQLKAGDCVLLTQAQTFCLASDLGLAPEDAVAAFSKAPQGGVTALNTGRDLTGLGGFFKFDAPYAKVLLALLPSVIYIQDDADKIALRSAMEMMMRELREPQPGGSLIAHHLSHLMLILALRRYIERGDPGGVSWLLALSDKHIGAALQAMHDQPSRRWTLQALAHHACLSRSVFAYRFKETVGEAPMEYLVRWRMMLAGHKLLHSNETIAAIAYSLGYESDSAFSAAFRRVMGCAPREYASSEKPSADAKVESEHAS